MGNFMRRFYYRFSLAAGFCLCFVAAVLPLKSGRSSALAAGREKPKPIAAAGGQTVPPGQKAGCDRLNFAGQSFIICRARPGRDTIRLFLTDNAGRPYKYFRNIRAELAQHGQKPLFLMNAGMYHKDYRPVGLYIENGKPLYPPARHSGKGNFFMKPNGIFYIASGKAGIMETEAFIKAGIKADLATQSGPLLVRGNRLHHRFILNSPYKEYRNGVGVTAQGEVLFAISEGKVNFDTFARLFRDGLHTPDALFFDGSISSLYAPEMHRADWFYPMGPIIGVIAPVRQAKPLSQGD
ncbi:MAG: hypothetical protein DU430_06980 [Candidatus Tokpelaia sp.]|nr:MAG: hypothetical protein DU430_06980 [Candidatus Tokpelaia sp.]